MTAVPHFPVHQSPSTIVVSVPGGGGTSVTILLVWASPIWGKDFATALQQSMEQSRLFAHVVKDGTANYQLRAFITKFDPPPLFGLSMTVSMEVDYTLSRNESKQVMWHKAITSNYTEPFSAAFRGSTRLQLATEGAARNNIEQAIQEMSQLGLE